MRSKIARPCRCGMYDQGILKRKCWTVNHQQCIYHEGGIHGAWAASKFARQEEAYAS